MAFGGGLTWGGILIAVPQREAEQIRSNQLSENTLAKRLTRLRRRTSVELLIKAIVSVFPEADASKITLDTKLAEIPGWDSMNAVNVLAQLEALTGRENLQLVFSNSLTISQILEALRAQGVEG